MSNSDGKGGASWAWPGRMRDVIPVDQESGEPGSSRLSVSKPFPKAVLPARCCERSSSNKAKCRSAKAAQGYLKEMDFTYKRYRYSLKKPKLRGVRARPQSDRRTVPNRPQTAVRVPVFRRIRFQSESASAVRMGKDRPDPRRRTARASAARERAWGLAP